MKPSPPDHGKSDRKFVQRLQAFIRTGKKKTHRLSANVTGEEDWEVDEPQIRMSRAFAVMLVLHLVAVGGLFAFHVFGKDDRDAELTATRTAHETSPPPPAVPVKSTAPVPQPVAAAPVSPPKAEIVPEEPAGQQHIFKSGETKMLIAAKFGVTVRELEEANPESTFSAGDRLVIPPPQRIIGALAQSKKPENQSFALIEATPSEDVGYRDFALKKGSEDPYAPVAPEEIRAMTPERSAPRSKTVKAEPELTLQRPEEDSEDLEVVEPVSVAAPKVKKPAPAPAPPAPAKPKPAATGSRTHVVAKGDTVYNVAKRYGLSPNEVMRANGITDPARLQMGKVLKISVRR